MSGIGVGVFLSVCRLLVDFRDDLGNLKSISGTGFWIVDRNDSFFVTNRHNVDPTLKLGSDTKFHTETVKLQLRTQTTPTAWGPGTAFVAVENLNFALRSHPTADVAILANPLLPPGHMVLNHGGFTLEEIATEYFLANSVGPMDVGSFVGFPGKDGKAWWDERWDFPIARTVNIASWPRIPFSNSAILTTDTVLVSGLSFSGSSGSRVISHEKGIKVGGALTGDGYVEPKLLGIMSGHWWNEEPTNGMFFHSGLSYFTRSTSIHELLTA